MEALLVMTTAPDRETALAIARELVRRRLAACVNVGSEVTSVYRWKGAVEEAPELPLAIKSTEAAYPALEAAIRELHPYELPEVVAVRITRGLSDYLDWVAAETIS
jgi:periplasmic divalent cation tolerance protein